jgi:enamine deaminase RidA (YjgF/YER057c/UK114 family)
MTHTRPSEEFITWASSLGIEDFKSIDVNLIKKKLREAQRELRDIEKQANELREEHLRELIANAEDNDADPNFQKRLKAIKKAHDRQTQYKKLRSILKPVSSGGLSYILVPKDFQVEQYPYEPTEVSEWEPIHEHEILQKFVQQRNIIHFGQAHGSPFTQPPLNRLDWQAESIEAKEILQGSVPISLLSNNEYTNKILQYIANREQLPEIDTYITPEQVSTGFKKWREDTSTSPSGCHLGLRRIPAFPTETKEQEKIRQSIQQVQADVINLPLEHGFSPSRWQVVINAMLEKIPGKPLLHKLRVIHILKADYNLALKEIFGRRLMKNCELHGTLGDRQDGFRKGRSTMRTLLQNELINDYNKRLRINNFVGLTDISGCFDRILPSIISLLNQRNGCPPEPVKTHAATLEKARYHLKSKHGISSNFYSHSEKTPIYGNGQGAGDSPSQWSQESAMLFDLFEMAVKGAQMSFRNGRIAATIPLTAFADDTNLLGNDDRHEMSVTSLVEQTRNAFQEWDKLLHATGHFMELGKCSCYLSIWDFQEDGYAFTIPPNELNIKIEVTDDDGVKQTIKQLATDESQKLLGVMKNPIGNQQDEVLRLRRKSDQFATKMNSHLLTRADAILAYEAFYVPAMRYSLGITSINQMDFELIQSSATTAFLAAMGYNRNMPRAVVHAPKLYQGLGLRHLYDLQGCDSTRLFLQEINMKKSSTNMMLKATLDAIQLESGIGKPIMEDTRPLDYIEWGWIPSIRDFLHHIEAKITGVTQNPPLFRKNDCYIMDSKLLGSLTHKERMLIHRCRLFLQVEVLSDISDAAGITIHEAWLHPTREKPSYSLKQWPKQSDPGKEAWRIWQKFISNAFTNQNGKLRNALGEWTRQNKNRVHRSYCNEGATVLYTRDSLGRWHAHEKRCAGRRCSIFHKSAYNLDALPDKVIPIDIKTETEEGIVTDSWSQMVPTEKDPNICSSLREYINLTAKKRSERIMLLIDENDMVNCLSNPTRIEVASDGGFDPSSGISSYGWIIAFNRSLVAKGQGPAEAHPDLAESFRSEGYGLASVTAFIMAMVTFLHIAPEEHSWKFYIDNKAMIQRMESYRDEIWHSKWNLRSDSDITNKAHEYLRNIPAVLVHVKSHQDNEKEMSALSFDAQLNIMADAMATQQRDRMSKPITRVTGDHCHLVIKDRYITRDSKTWLIRKSGEIPIQHYYREKYGWSISVFSSIHWELQHKALRSYNQNDQRRILKFTHEWLPTNYRLFREKQESSPACRLCGDLEETNNHMLRCTHFKQQQARTKLSDYLWRDNETHGNSELNNIIEIALSECTHNTQWTPVMSAISHELLPGIQQQNKIGWHQLYKGRIARDIIRFMESHYRGLPIDSKRYTGERWGKMLIKNIWNTVLRLWENRNEIVHGKQMQETQRTEKQRLLHRVHQYFASKDQLEQQDRERIFYKDEEAIQQEDTRYIKAWLKLAQRTFSIAKREQTKPRNEQKLMEQYFAWKPPIAAKSRKARDPRSPAETHPD